MVFGNMGDDSGTGVAFTRDPATGEKKLYGEFLTNAQGEDVVAGIRTPQTISQMDTDEVPRGLQRVRKDADTLENHYKDMQDMEFTIERGKLYMLQTRNGKRTPQAGMKIAVRPGGRGPDAPKGGRAEDEPRISGRAAAPRLRQEGPGRRKARGHRPARLSRRRLRRGVLHRRGRRGSTPRTEGLLVRAETSPEDINGMRVSQGILTARGGTTSHAAVVARGMGTCCVPAAARCISTRLPSG
jgi:pyruvate,orthophosphate dikinase